MDALAAQLPDMKAGVADSRVPDIFFNRMVPAAYHVVWQPVAENDDDFVVLSPLEELDAGGGQGQSVPIV